MTRRRMWLMVGLSAVAAVASCSRPLTDIVATSTEDVGDYEVMNASGTDALTATVCVARAIHARPIAERIVQQWANHGFNAIALEMVGPRPDGGIAVMHFTWRSGQGARITDPVAAPRSPCTVTRGRVLSAPEARREVHGTR